MPALRGFIDLYGGQTSFLVPVFVDRPGSNRILIQQITPTDTVGAFTEFDAEITYDFSGGPFEVKVGDNAIWAFRFADTGNIQHGSSNDIIAPLRTALTNGTFDHSPMTKHEVAHFCGGISAFQSSVVGPFRMLHEASPLSAEIWRDVVVLLPVIKRELASRLPNSMHPQILNDIRVTGARGTLIIELPTSVHKAVSENSVIGAIPETKQLARMFDLGEVTFSPRAVPSPARHPAPSAPLPFGVVQSFNGTGDRVIGRSPSNPSRSRSQVIFPPGASVRNERALRGLAPPFAFAILNPNSAQVADAKLFATRWKQETIKVAIVVLPTSFGTPRKDTLDVFRLTEVQETFDYTFIIANHVLRKPPGVAPNLTAFSRGVAVVQACIRAFMQLNWTYGAGAKDIRQRIPGNGLGLVGRFVSQHSLETSAASRAALDSMLSENLPLNATKSLVVMGTALEFDDRQDLFTGRHLRKLLPRPVQEVRDLLSFQTARRGSWHEVICLAFGIEPRRPNLRQFLAFCRNLVALCGWATSDSPKQDSFFIASHRHMRVLVGALVHPRDADDVINPLSSMSMREPRSSAVVLTGFTPSRSFAEWFESKRIRIVHYSHFERVADELDLPPRTRGAIYS